MCFIHAQTDSTHTKRCGERPHQNSAWDTECLLPPRSQFVLVVSGCEGAVLTAAQPVPAAPSPETSPREPGGEPSRCGAGAHHCYCQGIPGGLTLVYVAEKWIPVVILISNSHDLFQTIWSAVFSDPNSSFCFVWEVNICLFYKHGLNSSHEPDSVCMCWEYKSEQWSSFSREARVLVPIRKCQSSPGLVDLSLPLEIWIEGICRFGQASVPGCRCWVTR